MKKGILVTTVGILALSLLTPISASAQGLDAITQQEESAHAQAQVIDSQLQEALSAVNEKYTQISSLQAQIDDANKRLEEYQDEINRTQDSIDRRREVANAQLRNMQLNGGQEGLLDMLLSSDNLTDFISRSIAMNTIRNAQNEKVSSLVADVDRLSDLKAKQAQTTTQLAQDKQTLDEEAGDLQASVDSLRQKALDNQAAIQALAFQRSAEEERIRDEAMARIQQEADERAAQDAANNNNSGQAPAPPAQTPPPSNIGGGQLMAVQATAYSIAEPGMSNFTATGIDLRVNPWVIAVDPSVIPLGSIVEVPGYGVAIAGDTGGLIRGFIIDVHFPTVEQAIQWGRKNITIRILS